MLLADGQLVLVGAHDLFASRLRSALTGLNDGLTALRCLLNALRKAQVPRAKTDGRRLAESMRHGGQGALRCQLFAKVRLRPIVDGLLVVRSGHGRTGHQQLRLDLVGPGRRHPGRSLGLGLHARNNGSSVTFLYADGNDACSRRWIHLTVLRACQQALGRLLLLDDHVRLLFLLLFTHAVLIVARHRACELIQILRNNGYLYVVRLFLEAASHESIG